MKSAASPPLLMTPGPTPVAGRVLETLAEPVRSHASEENAATMRNVTAALRTVVGSRSARVHAFAGGGALAQEAAIVNHARAGDRIVVVNHGQFGDQFADAAHAFGIDVEDVRAQWGEHVEPMRLREAILAGRPPAIVTITQVDTSTGVLADCAALAATGRAAAPEAIIVVDSICAVGGIEVKMDAWDVDVIVAATQKALSVPPGMALLALSERAIRRRAALEQVSAYYADLQRWDDSVDDPIGACFSTHATSMLRALEIALEIVLAEGLPARCQRHRRVARRLRDGMLELGFAPLTRADVLAPTLSVLAAPAGIDPVRLRAGTLARGVMIGRCLGRWVDRGIRIGHMGNVGESEVDETIRVIARSLDGARALA